MKKYSVVDVYIWINIAFVLCGRFGVEKGYKLTFYTLVIFELIVLIFKGIKAKRIKKEE